MKESRAVPFRQRDVSRALRAARAAGVEIARVEIGTDGRIILVPSKPVENGPSATEDDLDRELAEFEAGHGQG